MKKGTLKSGFEFEVNENVLDDMELLDAIHDANENPLILPDVVLRVLGSKEQRKRLYDHLRLEDGRVPIQDVSDAIGEMLESIGEDGKNS